MTTSTDRPDILPMGVEEGEAHDAANEVSHPASADNVALRFEHGAYGVNAARQLAAEQDAKVQALREAWEAEHRVALEEQARRRADVQELETAWREAALALAEQRGAKTLEFGVVVASGVRLVYDESQALKWATVTGMALALDKAAFAKTAVLLLDVGSPEVKAALAFVTIESTRTVRLPNSERLAAFVAPRQAPEPPKTVDEIIAEMYPPDMARP